MFLVTILIKKNPEISGSGKPLRSSEIKVILKVIRSSENRENLLKGATGKFISQ